MEDLIKDACVQICNRLLRRGRRATRRLLREGDARTQWADALARDEHYPDLPGPKVLLNQWKQRGKQRSRSGGS